MSILTRPSAAFSTSLIYITVGTLIDIWTIVSLVFYRPSTDLGYFLVIGFFMTGIALLIIGLLLGPIGRVARNAELPPSTEMPAVVQAEQTAAANPPAVFNPAVKSATPLVAQSSATPIAPPASALER